MAEQVLAHMGRELSMAVYRPLKGAGTPASKLAAMLDVFETFYEGGRRACLLERLCASVDSERFRIPLRQAFTGWMGAIEALCLEAGLPKGVARGRAEDVVVRIQGALIVCAGTGKYDLFARTMVDLRSTVLAPVC